ncbi:AAA family ATPase [Candidatus Pacearchaeota archaeon]|jgi:nitric oxide reductase NorQ protein|nr:AAA family ATPase [Candidatus Pacearchaeota archaeon]|tara:strand:+ start:790 stop:1710 length:921 start_codon:yes stop_codon:yes gene_type:complete
MLKKDKITKYEDYSIVDEPYYEPVGNEITDFQVAFNCKRPLSLIGPTGCGKTTLALYMAYKLRQDLITKTDKGKTEVLEFSKSESQTGNKIAFPYIEIPCHEDMTETHLVGRYGLNNEWLPGPLYIGASRGGIVVLDEIVEARKDAVVLLHSLTDDRRVLYVAKKGEVITPPDNFMVVTCYNPGYQIRSKNLKQSTAQRFPTIQMNYPSTEIEEKIIIKKTGIEKDVASKLVRLGNEIREAKNNDTINLQEGVSTRLLIMASEFYLEYKKIGLEPDLKHIARVNIFNPISTEDTDRKSLEELLGSL